MKSDTFKNHFGFSLIEMLVYISLIAAIFVLIVNTLLTYTGSYRTLQAERLTEHSGIDAMERMSRDIRAAKTITTSQSTFGSSPGMLTLVQSSGSLSTTTEFYLDTSTNLVKVNVNGVYDGPLTAAGSKVTSLIFTELTSSNSTAVKIDMTVQGISGPVTVTKNYHDTIILRGSMISLCAL